MIKIQQYLFHVGLGTLCLQIKEKCEHWFTSIKGGNWRSVWEGRHCEPAQESQLYNLVPEGYCHNHQDVISTFFHSPASVTLSSQSSSSLASSLPRFGVSTYSFTIVPMWFWFSLISCLDEEHLLKKSWNCHHHPPQLLPGKQDHRGQGYQRWLLDQSP